MSDVRDFDTFWSEKDEEASGTAATIPVRFEGREYRVPAVPPALVLLRAARMQREGVENVDADGILVIAEGLLSRPVLDEITASNPSLGAGKLFQFLGWVMEQQAGPAPNRETRRAKRRSPSTSSKRGASSKRTSSANTGSTFAST